ncbi:MAG: HIT family protein [Peptococcaceae bacterium]|nr:HIT family protein [Candidatus Syntrophopropionicum ammoniitolerans]
MKKYCPFCDPERIEGKVAENGTVFALEDMFPVTPGHMLIIPYRHTTDYFTMTSQEIQDVEGLVRHLRDKITSEDPAVRGFNIGINCGITAGQSVMHAHIHLIPRREGDTENPRGGVRGVIPCKRGYRHV